MSSVIPTFRPTMRDVAREAGVSAMTVSRVLKDPAIGAAATRERVEAAVARLGYVPDRIASALSSGQSGLVAALLPTLAGSIFNSTVAGMSTTLAAEGYQLLLGITDYSIEGEEALLRAAISRRPDGVVVTGG
ncbi:MAG: LacI family DNA-binding transcriptional regulator, partial [Geminicoccaceae bacterium]